MNGVSTRGSSLRTWYRRPYLWPFLYQQNVALCSCVLCCNRACWASPDNYNVIVFFHSLHLRLSPATDRLIYRYVVLIIFSG